MKNIVTGSARRLGMAAGVLAVLLVVYGVGCRKQTPETPEANAPAGGQASTTTVAPKEKEPEPAVDKVLAVVNGVEITESRVKQAVQEMYGAQLAASASRSPEFAAQQEKMVMKDMTNRIVMEQLLDEEVKKAGIKMTDEQVDAEMTKELAALTPPRTLDEYKQQVEAGGRDFAAMKAQFAQQMTYVKLLEAQDPNCTTVTEADAKTYYDEHPDKFKVSEQVQASHILVSTEPKDPNADPNQVKAQAHEKAEKLLKQVKDGADFATVAKENSDCPSAAQGGDLGMFEREQMVKPFADAAFSMKIGDISDIVETRFGYHIIKVTGHQDAGTIAFADVKDKLMANLKSVKTNEAFQKYLAMLQGKATITYPSADGAPVPSKG